MNQRSGVKLLFRSQAARLVLVFWFVDARQYNPFLISSLWLASHPMHAETKVTLKYIESLDDRAIGRRSKFPSSLFNEARMVHPTDRRVLAQELNNVSYGRSMPSLSSTCILYPEVNHERKITGRFSW